MSLGEAARLLVVEDDRDTALLLRDLLVAEGYEVESVPTGEAALDTL
ncbi:MAG: DNA-binding response regulator, partial [Candidatus Rokuibacteriota bacterium]